MKWDENSERKQTSCSLNTSPKRKEREDEKERRKRREVEQRRESKRREKKQKCNFSWPASFPDVLPGRAFYSEPNGSPPFFHSLIFPHF